MRPLADRIRPTTLDEVVGQRHLLGEGKLLYRLITEGKMTNMIFYGPSGTGKTTVANIAARMSGMKLYRLNATNAGLADVKAIASELDALGGGAGVLLYLDEIQNFNKKQQQSLLEWTENGAVTLIASTTENPYFYIYNAILSRSTVFEFRQVEPEEIRRALSRCVSILESDLGGRLTVSDDAMDHLSQTANDDVRKAVTALELCVSLARVDADGGYTVDLDDAQEASQRRSFRYDRDGDSHYDVLSAFQKSIRGSDADAGLHYLARLILGGDLASICRRLLVIAAEDVGLAYPQAMSAVKSCVDAALQLGLPEARIPLAEAVVLLATSPKSNSACLGIDAAIHDIENGETGDVPTHLKDAHYSGAAKLGHGEKYRYAHDYPNHWTPQQYLPDAIRDRRYYEPGDNKAEQAAKSYWDAVRAARRGNGSAQKGGDADE